MLECTTLMGLNTLVSIILFALSLVLPLGYVIMCCTRHHKIPELYELMLKYSMVLNIGCAFLITCIGEFVYTQQVAICMGWPWSPFQHEVACSQLSLGVMGFLCALYSAEFWLATLVCATIWLWGAAAVHIADAVNRYNYCSGNIGFVLYWDLFLPCWLIALYIIARKNYRITPEKDEF